MTGFAAGRTAQRAGERTILPRSSSALTVIQLLFLYCSLSQPPILFCFILRNHNLLYFLGYRFINARRRIVQPMIDQSNRAGKSPVVTVFKSRKRKPSSSHSPGGPIPGKYAGSECWERLAIKMKPVSFHNNTNQFNIIIKCLEKVGKKPTEKSNS